MKNVTKFPFIAGLCLVVAVIGAIEAFDRYVTAFDIIQLNQNAIRDSSSTTRLSVGSTNAITGNLTVSGTAAITGVLSPTTLQIVTSTAPRDTSALVGITPTAAGQLAFNSTDSELCLSTGTTRFTWIQISTFQVTACRH